MNFWIARLTAASNTEARCLLLLRRRPVRAEWLLVSLRSLVKKKWRSSTSSNHCILSRMAILYCGSALTGIRLGCSPGAEWLFLFSSAYSRRSKQNISRWFEISPLKRGRINIVDIWLPNPSVLARFSLTWYIQIMMSSLIQNTQSSASQSPTKLYNLQSHGEL